MSNPAVAGQKFGKLVLVRPVEGTKPEKWVTLCECGNETVKRLDHVKAGRTRSCGCAKKAYHGRIIGAALQKREKT